METTNRQHADVRVETTHLGRGLAASRSFRRGRTLGPVTGELIADPEYGSDYCIDLGDDRVLEPAEPFRYLNHSCEPNCQLFVWEDDGQTEDQLWLEVLRPIAAGEQLTIDYGWPADAATPCACGSSKCRGWIVSLEELMWLKAKDDLGATIGPLAPEGG